MVSQKVVSLPKGATFGSKFETVLCVDVRRNGQKIRNASLICTPKKQMATNLRTKMRMELKDHIRNMEKIEIMWPTDLIKITIVQENQHHKKLKLPWTNDLGPVGIMEDTDRGMT